MSIVLTSAGETVPSQASKSTKLNEPLPVLQEGTDDEQKNQSRTIDDFFAHAHNTVRLDHRPFFLAKRVPYYLVYVALALVNIGNTAATTSMGFLFAYESFEGISRGREGVIASSYYLGACIGGFLGGVISDIIGRRPVLLAGLFLTSSVGLLSAFASGMSTLQQRLLPALLWYLTFLRCLALLQKHGVSASAGRLLVLALALLCHLFQLWRRSIRLLHIVEDIATL